MLNVIRMEFYRMLKSKSFYIAGICLILTMLFSTNMSAEEWKKSTPEERQELHELFLREAQTESVATISVTIPTEANARVTVYDLFFANIKSKLIALVFACFTVIYATADITSGYVKNIAGADKEPKISHLCKNAQPVGVLCWKHGISHTDSGSLQSIIFRLCGMGTVERFPVLPWNPDIASLCLHTYYDDACGYF